MSLNNPKPLKNNLPLAFIDVLGLETDLELLRILVEAQGATLPKEQFERIQRIRRQLKDMKNDKSLKWWDYGLPDWVNKL